MPTSSSQEPSSDCSVATLLPTSGSWHNAERITAASDVEPTVNVVEGLQIIRERLDANGADPETLTLVDTIMRRAALPAAAPASAQSLLQLTRMLARTPVANKSITVYNDLLRLEEQLQVAATEYRERVQAEESKPLPKTKKFYKQAREREQKRSG
jgi:hypothetical protein